MADDSIQVRDIEKLTEFSNELTAYIKKVREIEEEIKARLARLGETWKDQEYERFRQSFVRVGKQLPVFEEVAQGLPPKIASYSELIRDIHRDPLPR